MCSGPMQLSCFMPRLLLSAGNHRFICNYNVESSETGARIIMHFVTDQED